MIEAVTKVRTVNSPDPTAFIMHPRDAGTLAGLTDTTDQPLRMPPALERIPMLVTTADTDDRVVPGHSFKFAAALQAMQAGNEPVLIRIETKAGHGAGKPTSKQIEEAADKWAFLEANLR